MMMSMYDLLSGYRRHLGLAVARKGRLDAAMLALTG